ncbi:hypothetical protein BDP55DRAFT_383099 [Colletotrichum godetiae]|uniref:Uncharacterized protein n=1 Tax=Colletotrichum godetiae TaxID=1209918 RepID=A0AAJ0EXI3_9PEZI|nr:uncharacterized protein BDP55DRAFT_383099 [Colletotrichum godetiae]KAK1689920.1 hypothetical protein BDP55DRAFT_383099 [Colletotrichum godetiae]
MCPEECRPLSRSSGRNPVRQRTPGGEAGKMRKETGGKQNSPWLSSPCIQFLPPRTARQTAKSSRIDDLKGMLTGSLPREEGGLYQGTCGGQAHIEWHRPRGRGPISRKTCIAIKPFNGVFQPAKTAFPWHAWLPLGGKASDGWPWPLGAADERQGKTKMNAVAATRDIFVLRRNRTHADGWPSSFIQCGEWTWQSSSHHCYTLIFANWTSVEFKQLSRNEARHLADCRAKTAFRRDQPLAADRCRMEID